MIYFARWTIRPKPIGRDEAALRFDTLSKAVETSSKSIGMTAVGGYIVGVAAVLFGIIEAIYALTKIIHP